MKGWMTLDHVFFEVGFSFMEDKFDVFWGFLGNIGCRFQEGSGSSFSRERMTYFGSWILKHISVVFWMMQLHAIFDHVLKHKWWVDRELHFHVPIFLKKWTCRTGINISRKWLDQAPKNIDLYLFFFRFPGLWLVTVPLIFSLAHGGSCELPPKSFFLIPRHVDLFCRKSIVWELHSLEPFGNTWQHKPTNI